MRLGIKQVLSLGALMLGMVGVGCDDQPTYYHYIGTVVEIHWGSPCTDVVFKKQDESIVSFRINGVPPTWKGMYGDILLQEDGYCGYRMVSAKEQK